MASRLACSALALIAMTASAAGMTVDADVPAGNAVVERVEGDSVCLHQDLRDSDSDWFYWKFRVVGAAGRTLHFQFTRSSAVGSRGAAVSTDRGRTWRWSDEVQPSLRREERTNDHPDWKAFDWTFGPDDNEVWFAQTIPYDASDWQAFLDRHAADRGRLFETGVLCRSRKGREVEYARFGRLDGKARERVFLSSRHHCGETSATYVLEGVAEQVFADDDLGAWLRENVEFRVVPFADKDGVVDGDQGKRRRPHDHARDYNEGGEIAYPEVRAIMKMLRNWRPTVVNDMHSPWLRSSWFKPDSMNEIVYQVGLNHVANAVRQGMFGRILERGQKAGVGYRQSDDYAFGRGWNTSANFTQGKTLVDWAVDAFPDARLVTTFEIPFANSRFKTLNPGEFRAFGRDVAAAYREYLGGMENLGSPLAARYPDSFRNGSGAYARNVWTMRAFDGRVYVGCGNSSNGGPAMGCGPVPIVAYDPKRGTFVEEWRAPDEQIDVFHVFSDGALYVPGHDPTEDWELGNFYRRRPGEGVAWEKVRTLPKGVHCYDMAEFDGRLFALGYGIYESVDRGAKFDWTKDVRHYAFLRFPETLYAVATASEPELATKQKPKSFQFVWDVPGETIVSRRRAGGGFERVMTAKASDLFPDTPETAEHCLKPGRASALSGKLVYIGGIVHNDHQMAPVGAYVAEDGPEMFHARRISLPKGATPWATLAEDDLVYLLYAVEEPAGGAYRNTVAVSDDGENFKEVFSFRAPTFARAFARLDGRFYFGLGTEVKDHGRCTGRNSLEVEFSNDELSSASGVILRTR